MEITKYTIYTFDIFSKNELIDLFISNNHPFLRDISVINKMEFSTIAFQIEIDLSQKQLLNNDSRIDRIE